MAVRHRLCPYIDTLSMLLPSRSSWKSFKTFVEQAKVWVSWRAHGARRPRCTKNGWLACSVNAATQSHVCGRLLRSPALSCKDAYFLLATGGRCCAVLWSHAQGFKMLQAVTVELCHAGDSAVNAPWGPTPAHNLAPPLAEHLPHLKWVWLFRIPHALAAWRKGLPHRHCPAGQGSARVPCRLHRNSRHE